MQTKTYSLPEWNFVGGETQKRTFTLYEAEDDERYNLQGATAEVVIVDFVNCRTAPKLRKEVSIQMDANENYCEAVVMLSPTDTIDLFGKFIYQITIKDVVGNVAALKGTMRISENINKAFIR